MDEMGGPPRRKGLLDHFATITDARQPCKVMYPLGEVLALVVCATIAACDDYDDIVLWGNAHLSFLRRLAPYHWGVPCADWLRVVMNRVDPDLFAACFRDFVADMLPGSVDQIAIDGKTSRRSHDRGRGQAALHLVSAYATTHNLVLGQVPVPDKTNEIGAIPVLLSQLGEKDQLQGALVTIDAMGCTPGITEAIVDAGADYLIATKDNQPTVLAEIERYFAEAPASEIDTICDLNKAHGRIETRRCRVSTVVDWMSGHRRYPGEPRFKGLAAIAVIETTIEKGGQTILERRCFVSSATLDARRFAAAVRNHWRIENGLHWVLDVTFKEDQSRLRKGHGAKNMAVVRHFALNLVRTAPGPKSIKGRRKLAGWDTAYLLSILTGQAR
jgi:predicted transposase YbfD/YdcC